MSSGGPDDDLRWASAASTAAKVRSGELSALAVVAAALDRLTEANAVLNAFVEADRSAALDAADDVTRRLAAGEHLPLAGVPVAVKDDLPRAGSVVRMGSRAVTTASTHDAPPIAALKAAGAVVIGATRTPELCLVPHSESAIGGAVRNPWDPTRTPGGSSGGSAAAVAAGVVPIALADDGGGSIRGPAAWCGLPGLFATPGTIDPGPDIDDWTGFGSMGGLARSVADTALLYDVLGGRTDWSLAVVQEPPRLRVGISCDRAIDRPVPLGGAIDGAWRDAAKALGSILGDLGHDVSPVSMRFGQASAKFAVRYLRTSRRVVASLDEPSRVEPYTALSARLGRVAKPLERWAMDTSAERRAVERSLAGLDLLLTPTMPCGPTPIGERVGQPALQQLVLASRRVAFLSTWNLMGRPGITLPTGLDQQGRPVGALLTAAPGREELLLQVAAQVERRAPWPRGAELG